MDIQKQKRQLPIAYKSTSYKFDRPSTETRIVKGYFAAFNLIDSDNDIIRSGAFTKSLNERGVLSESNRKIKYLHQHNPLEPIGPLLVLQEDSYGLYFEASMERTPLGDVVLERYSNGTYTEHSIGFKYVMDKCEFIKIPVDIGNEAKPVGSAIVPESNATVEVFECRELNLFEGSVVTWGANENTPFVGFKGTKQDAENILKDELNYLIKKSPSYEYELQLRKLYQKQFELINSFVEQSTKGVTIQVDNGIDYNKIINNLKL